MNTLILIIFASLFVSSIALSGLLILVWKKVITGNLITYLVSFAAGILLSTAFLDLLPEATESKTEMPTIFMVTLLSIVTFFFLERFVVWFHHHNQIYGTKPAVVLILVGDTLHNFLDGVAIAAAFLINPSLGITTTLAISAHEIPHEIADFSMLIAGGIKKISALFYNFLSGLAALVGAIFGFYFLESIEGLLPLAIASTAGMFIYIACADLIPDLHKDFKKKKSWLQSLPFILGIAVGFIIVNLLHSN